MNTLLFLTFTFILPYTSLLLIFTSIAFSPVMLVTNKTNGIGLKIFWKNLIFCQRLFFEALLFLHIAHLTCLLALSVSFPAPYTSFQFFQSFLFCLTALGTVSSYQHISCCLHIPSLVQPQIMLGASMMASLNLHQQPFMLSFCLLNSEIAAKNTCSSFYLFMGYLVSILYLFWGIFQV